MKQCLHYLKTFTLLLAFVLTASMVSAQKTAVAGGSWSTPTTWSPVGAPTATDAVTINSGVTVTMDVANGACASLTININAVGTNGLTISGTNTLTVGGNVTLNQPTAGTSTLAVGTGTLTLSNSLAGTISIPGSATASRFATVSVSTGTINCAAITFSGTAAQARLTFTGAGKLNVGNGTTGTLGSGGTIAVSSSTINYNGDAQTVLPIAYNNLVLSGSGVKTLTGLPNISNLTMSGSATATTASAFIIANDVILNNTAGLTTGNTLTISGDLTLASGTLLTVGGFNFTVTGNTSVTGTLTHNNASGTKTFTGNVTINTGGTWNDDAAVIPVAFGGNLQNDGTFNAGTGVHSFSGNRNFVGTISIPNITTSGIRTNYGTLTVSTALSLGATLAQTANAVINIGGTISGGGALTATASPNTVNYTGSGQTIRATTYHHLNLSGSGTATAAAALSLNGDLTIGSGVTFNGSTFSHSVSGNWINNGGTFSGAGTVTFDGTTQSIGGTSSTTFNNLIINGNPSTTTLAINTSIAGDLTLSTGDVLDLSTFSCNRTASGAGTLSLTSSSTLKLSNTSGGQTGSNFPLNFNTNTLSGTVNYNNATGGQTIFGTTYSTLTLGNTSGTQNAGGNIITATINNNTNSANIFDMGAFTLFASTINNTGTIKTQNTSALPLPVGETWGGIVEYNGAAQTVSRGTYNNLITSGSGTKAVSTGASTTVSGNLTIGTGTNLTIAGAAFTVDGTSSISGTLTITSTTSAKTFDNIIINSGGLFNSSVNEDFSLTGSLQVDGTGSITSGTGTWTFSGTGTPTLSGTGTATITNADFATNYANNGTFSFVNLDVAGTGTVILTNNGTINVSATLTGADNFVQGATGILNFGGSTLANTGFNASATGNTVNYTAAAQTVRGVAYSNLTLSGSAAKTLGAATTVNGILSMQGTASLALGTFALTYGASSTLEYAGSTSQTTTNTEFKAPGGPANLTINNGNGVTLHAARTIGGVVTFTNGILNTNSALLTINGTVSGASDASFADGPVKKVGIIGAGGFDFPVGKSGVGYMKIGVANVSDAAAEFTAQYFRASAMFTFDTVGLDALGIQAVSNCEYWTLNRAVTTSNADVTLYWNAHSPCGNGPYLVDPLFGVRIVHYNTSASKWDAQGGGTPSGDASVGSVTWTGVSNFSPFALGAAKGSQNGLPVMFNAVKAYEKNSGVQIEWTNLTERDLVNYIVERSANGVNFTGISQELPRSNQNDKESYSSFDATPFTGVNYYRIKVLEISGKVIYSKIVRVDIGKNGETFTLYPNPVKGNQVSVAINNKQGRYTLKVINTAGQEIYSQRIVHQGGSMTQNIELPSAIKPGVYNMLISGDNYREAKMFVVQ